MELHPNGNYLFFLSVLNLFYLLYSTSLFQSGGVCGFADCYAAAKALYIEKGINFNVDRKTVRRIVDSIVEARGASIHVVTDSQATIYLKSGTNLIFLNSDDTFSEDELCTVYSDRLSENHVNKKSLQPKVIPAIPVSEHTENVNSTPLKLAPERHELLSCAVIPALRDIMPDIEQQSSYR